MRKLTVALLLVIAILLAGRFWQELNSIANAGGADPLATLLNGDVNGDQILDMSDAVYLLIHLFNGGPEPVAFADSPEMLGRVSALESAFVGTVSAYAGASDNLPSGWLLCDGSEVSRDEYPRLFAAIGTAHGEGDGAMTFNLPDYRGMFLRGVDNGAGNDPEGEARSVGSVQDHAVGTHGHEIDDPGHEHENWTSVSAADSGQQSFFPQAYGGHNPDTRRYNYPVDPSVTGITVTTPTGANVSTETRPLNSAVNYIIKY